MRRFTALVMAVLLGVSSFTFAGDVSHAAEWEEPGVEEVVFDAAGEEGFVTEPQETEVDLPVFAEDEDSGAEAEELPSSYVVFDGAEEEVFSEDAQEPAAEEAEVSFTDALFDVAEDFLTDGGEEEIEETDVFAADVTANDISGNDVPLYTVVYQPNDSSEKAGKAVKAQSFILDGELKLSTGTFSTTQKGYQQVGWSIGRRGVDYREEGKSGDWGYYCRYAMGQYFDRWSTQDLANYADPDTRTVTLYPFFASAGDTETSRLWARLDLNAWGPEYTEEGEFVREKAEATIPDTQVESFQLSECYDGDENLFAYDLPYTYGTGLNSLPVPTRNDHWTFAGWYDVNTNKQVKKIAAKTGKIDLYAAWTPKTYTISFDLNAASVKNARISGKMKPVKAAYDPNSSWTSFGQMNLKAPGYRLTGWKDQDNRMYTGGYDKVLDRDITLTAVWQPISYYLQLQDYWAQLEDDIYEDLPEDEGDHTARNAFRKALEADSRWRIGEGDYWADTNYTLQDSKFTLPVLPDLNGWKFEGWYDYTNSSGQVIYQGKKVESIDPAKVKKERVYLKSKWTKTTTVTFHAGKEAGAATKTQRYNLTSGTFAILPACSFKAPEGKLFEGWQQDEGSQIYVEGDAVDCGSFDYDGATDWYACWTDAGKEYEIAFENDMRDVTKFDNARQVTETTEDGYQFIQYRTTYRAGEGLDLKKFKPERANYTFEGWYNNPNCVGKKITSISKKAGGFIVVYAKWVPKKVTILFDNNAAAINGVKHKTVKQATKFNTWMMIKPNPVKAAGYWLAGWKTADSPIKDVYDREEYEEMRKSAGKSLGAYSYDSSINLYRVPDGFFYNGGQLIGWGSLPSGASTVTLKAVWVRQEYNYSFRLEGGRVDTAALPANFSLNSAGDEDLNCAFSWKTNELSLPTPTRLGYTFDGWYVYKGYNAITRKELYGKKVTKATLANQDLIAKWKPKAR